MVITSLRRKRCLQPVHAMGLCNAHTVTNLVAQYYHRATAKHTHGDNIVQQD